MNGRNKEIYNGVESECNIKISIFTDGINYIIDVYAKVMQSYQVVLLSDGEDLPGPEKQVWW